MLEDRLLPLHHHVQMAIQCEGRRNKNISVQAANLCLSHNDHMLLDVVIKGTTLVFGTEDQRTRG